MTSIHAPIPQNLKDAVLEAKRRGESDVNPVQSEPAERPAPLRTSSSTSSVVMKKEVPLKMKRTQHEKDGDLAQPTFTGGVHEDSEEQDDAKENDPAQSPSPVICSSESMRKNVLGKRPLSELPTPIDPEATDTHTSDVDFGTTASDLNILAGRKTPAEMSPLTEPVRKSPKLNVSAQDTNAHGRIREDITASSANNSPPRPVAVEYDEKENLGDVQRMPSNDSTKTVSKTPSTHAASEPPRPTLRKVSNIGSSRSKAQARTGIRRL